MARNMIRDLPATSNPAYRIREYGSTHCAPAELLATILGTPDALALAQELLAGDSALSEMASASVSDLMARGVGKATATRVVAAFELGRRASSVSAASRPTVKSKEDVWNVLGEDMSVLGQEEMRVIRLDTRNRVTGIEAVYRGSLNAAVVRIGELFREAIKSNAAAIILVHNHPSGDPAPSHEDIRLTRNAVQAGKLLNIEVLEHVIVGSRCCVSLRERGFGFE